jgi:hypothetical protein
MNTKITETNEYQDMLNRVSFENVKCYLKENQGKTLENIISELNEEEYKDGIKYLIDNVWINHWNSFLHSGGRIIKNNDKYYYLSPKNKKIRERIPVIDFL